MQASLSTLQSQDRFTLPQDLGAWIDKATLRAWIEEEIGTLNWSNPELVAYLAANPAYKPRRMLCLLTYAYATGLFGSDEIVRSCYEEENLRSFCQQESPTAIAIKRFRRENRGLLKWCLEQLFKRAFRKRFGLEDSFVPAGLQRYLDHAAATRLNIARQMDRTEEP